MIFKNNQTKIPRPKNTLSETKTLDRRNSRLNTIEEKINKLKHIAIEIIQNETQRGKA